MSKLLLSLYILIYVVISQVPLFCDISLWNTVGNVDICPPYYPCCFHFKGNSSVYRTINANELSGLASIGRGWQILYWNIENIPSTDGGNELRYTDSYNCSGVLNTNRYPYLITRESNNATNYKYESQLQNCDYISPQINLTINFADIEVYYMNGYYCNSDCPDPTPAPTVQPIIYDNTDNIYEEMCNNIVKDPDWINSGNPDGIDGTFNSIICPSITNKQCCTRLLSPSIWIAKSYNLTLYSNIYVRFSLSNYNYDDQTDRTQVLYNCGADDWIELDITTNDEIIVRELNLIPECDHSSNVSIAFWTHYTPKENEDKWARIGDYEICNGPCTTTTTNQPSNDDGNKNNAGVVIAGIYNIYHILVHIYTI